MPLSDKLLSQKIQTPFQYHASVDSTNDLALQWLKAGASSGSAIIADEQRAGRGRKGRVWHTPPDVALAISVILHPPAQHAGRCSLLGAVAVADLGDSLGIAEVGIKWPNDVQVAGKKVSGILPEAAWDGDTLLGVVLGVGVNVRVQFDDALAQTAASLEPLSGQVLNRADLASYLLQRIIYWSAHLAGDHLFNTWQSRLNTLGQTVQVEGIVGKAQAVDDSGALLLTLPDGSIRRMMAGDIMHLVE